jgi:hypothetical protein
MIPMNRDPRNAEIEGADTNVSAEKQPQAARPLRRRQERPVHPPQFEIAMAALDRRTADDAMNTGYDPCPQWDHALARAMLAGDIFRR